MRHNTPERGHSRGEKTAITAPIMPPERRIIAHSTNDKDKPANRQNVEFIMGASGLTAGPGYPLK
jgi:hypothetical protein